MLMKRTTPEVTCPNCSKVGTWGMATHIKWCDPYIDVAGFNAKVRRGANDECWPFTGAKVPAGGYGRYTLNYKFQAAHRIAYMLAYGNIAPGLDIMHLCDNPPCCNPAHLRAATTAENMADCYAKGRYARGEKTKRNKLTEADVRSIREKFAAVVPKKSTVEEWAAQYGVTPATLINAAEGRTWSHLK